MNVSNGVLRVEHLQYADGMMPFDERWLGLLGETRQLRAALEKARTEIGLLTDERDQLLDAMRIRARPERKEAAHLVVVR